MITPWILANRTLYVTTYHKHSEDLENGEYAVFRSSSGNDGLSDQYAEALTGEDVEADMLLFMLRVQPISPQLSRV